MATRTKDIPQVRNPPGGDGHYVTYRDMTASELAERKARQQAYEAMLARQAAYERERWATLDKKPVLSVAGSVFAKSCKLPDGIIDYNNPNGYVPADLVKQYGDLMWLGGRSADPSGTVPLMQIGAGAVPLTLGRLALGSSAATTAATAGGTVGAALLTGIVALLWPSSLDDSALYSEDQLRNLKQARSRMRLNIEQQADGSLKGYGFYTGQNRDWEMVDVVQFTPRADQFVADLGDGIELIWTPATNPADTLGIPALEAAPQAPPIWIYPPTPMADSIIVDPIYPPEYKDFILVFPADSGVRPVYVVASVRRSGNADHDYHPAPETEEITGIPNLKSAKKKTPKQAGAGLRERWVDPKGRTIYEWDSRHGELEAYRASDGSHLGAFDHETGLQVSQARKNRSIKKYL
ncbi:MULTISPECIES: colicin E3/pyocin S6 family cytotoxin [unclassified Pseudomonas]|uniref:colicin E3/pyocin S6 family cytotoxin n=1 Tax=unclassified Pseudomonas TaxID=196821 RepID=UPI00119E0D3A|nr:MULTISPECIES: colicin E3/pyocin S6 family cytotoxin [unclassified Pseudomonas]TWC22043.1 S-type pyocin [Pseudomonas sp. SJZ075]TWC37377.1 S-type pyocin [Pseudomonas sp. SJZ078]TWC58022.1 S-type pyocin [Pseudomonas sp. SJZ124]TWC93772.1 S-type pyocin [Pseudomonas sp. SJZ101]